MMAGCFKFSFTESAAQRKPSAGGPVAHLDDHFLTFQMKLGPTESV